MRTLPVSRTVAAAAAGLALTGIALSTLAIAAPPVETERPGRYNMQPADGGILRLDTETGAMSMCAKRGSGYSCEPVHDDRSGQKELERLTAENRDLRGEIGRASRLFRSTRHQI